MVSIKKITKFLDRNLKISEIEDKSQNGLQVSATNPYKDIKRIAIAVDANAEVFEKARKYDMLITHHGLLWSSNPMITGTLRNRIKILLDNDLALHTIHLPLDLNETYGNNAELVRLLGASIIEKFDYGFLAEFEKAKPLKEIINTLNTELNTETKIYGIEKSAIKRFVVISGGASYCLRKEFPYGTEMFLLGEMNHADVSLAKEQKMTVLEAGHYATETLGVKAIARKLKELFPELEIDFIDVPSGL